MHQGNNNNAPSDGRIVESRLDSGKTVKLAYWDVERPTEHTSRTQNTAWNQHRNRGDLGFYESTIQYMRNDWAAKHMSPQHVSDGKGWHGMLYYSGVTKTWHTNDALDIDHAVPWKQHLKNLGVDNLSDAHKGYNDVANLRMLPSIYNRARDSADKILLNDGPQSQKWQTWVRERFSFDHTVQYAPFDPETDFSRRKQTTRDQPWTEDNTRSQLSFDTRVMEKWFNHELEKNFACSVKMTNPDGSGVTEVPLFKCAATGQLVTRDALDIHDDRTQVGVGHHVGARIDVSQQVGVASVVAVLAREALGEAHAIDAGQVCQAGGTDDRLAHAPRLGRGSGHGHEVVYLS